MRMEKLRNLYPAEEVGIKRATHEMSPLLTSVPKNCAFMGERLSRYGHLGINVMVGVYKLLELLW